MIFRFDRIFFLGGFLGVATDPVDRSRTAVARPGTGRHPSTDALCIAGGRVEFWKPGRWRVLNRKEHLLKEFMFFFFFSLRSLYNYKFNIFIYIYIHGVYDYDFV